MKNPQSLDYCLDLIWYYNSHIIILDTPESFMHSQFQNAQWELTKENAHWNIADQIVTKSLEKIEEEEGYAQEILLDWLSNWSLKDMQEYAQASDALKKEIDLPELYRKQGFTPEGKGWWGFSDYPWLQVAFLQQVFDANDGKFFINVPPNSAQNAFELVRMPAILGIDRHTVGIFWFNE